MQIEGSKRMRLRSPKARKTDEAGSGFQSPDWKPSGFFPSANGWDQELRNRGCAARTEHSHGEVVAP